MPFRAAPLRAAPLGPDAIADAWRVRSDRGDAWSRSTRSRMATGVAATGIGRGNAGRTACAAESAEGRPSLAAVMRGPDTGLECPASMRDVEARSWSGVFAARAMGSPSGLPGDVAGSCANCSETSRMPVRSCSRQNVKPIAIAPSAAASAQGVREVRLRSPTAAVRAQARAVSDWASSRAASAGHDDASGASSGSA